MRSVGTVLVGLAVVLSATSMGCGSSGSNEDGNGVGGSAAGGSGGTGGAEAGVGGTGATGGTGGLGGTGGSGGSTGGAAGTAGSGGVGGAAGTAGTGGGAGTAGAGGAAGAGAAAGSAGSGGGPVPCNDASECDDSLFCTGVETCVGGFCQPGPPPACSDDITCTDDYCSTATDSCTHSNNDTNCSDGNFCNGTEGCDPANGDPTTGCVAGTAPNCDDAIDCTVDSCSVAAGACLHEPDHASCQNSSFCDGQEVCTPGIGCEAGPEVDCVDNVPCSIDTCNESTQDCDHTANDAFCDDGLFCNGSETCDLTNGCTAGTSVTCANADGIACTVEACSNTTLDCVSTPDHTLCDPGEFCVPSLGGDGCTTAQPCTLDSECDDGNLCNGTETCNVVCQAGSPPFCDDGVICTIDGCDPNTGDCTHTPSNAACDDGLVCNGSETCDATNDCQAGVSVVCDDGVACTYDTCQEPSGSCSHQPFNYQCDDGVLCNGVEVCTLTGCEAGAPHVCPPDGIDCTNDICDTATDQCTYVEDDSHCACGQTCLSTQGGCGNFCQVKACTNGNVYECGDCIDNDGDCGIDGKDTQCLGPCDNTEDSGPTQGTGCYFAPPPGDFQPELQCAWNGPPAGDSYAAWNDVVMTPVVINLTDDDGDTQVGISDVPDIAFVAYRYQEDGCCNTNGVLRVVSGRCNANGTMTQHYSVGATEIQAQSGVSGIWLDSSGGLATGDIDNDGLPEIVGTINGGGTVAFENDGKLKWIQLNYPKSPDHLAGTQPSIADLDADGVPEIIQGRVVLDGPTGALVWKGTAGIGINGFMGPVSSVADPDLDGKLNVLAGNTMYDENGAAMWTYAYAQASTSANCGSGTSCDGYTATGNFDADPEGEIVIVRIGKVYVLNHDGTPMQYNGSDVIIDIPVSTCSRNEGGPPTIADFDGDGRPEIGAAGANYYIVADLDCLDTPLPANCDSPGILWKVTNADCSSRVTGSSVFDFDGDGNAEVIYNDEQRFRIFNGTTGAILVDIGNHSHTRLEMPIVADVDNDGNAEIVFIENAWGGAGQGIRVWGDANDSWVATRRIWNQHSYHVTNVSETGDIPMGESPNWQYPSSSTVSGVMNNFRQNLPEFDVLSAPDLSVTLSFDNATCPAGMGLVAEVCNEGELLVGPGVPVAFYDDDTQAAISCSNAPVSTTQTLNPGDCETVVCVGPSQLPSMVRVCVDNDGVDCLSGGNNECIETNNAATAQSDSCPQT